MSAPSSRWAVMVCTVESRFAAARARNPSLCVFDVCPDIRCSKDSGKTYQSRRPLGAKPRPASLNEREWTRRRFIPSRVAARISARDPPSIGRCGSCEPQPAIGCCSGARATSDPAHGIPVGRGVDWHLGDRIEQYPTHPDFVPGRLRAGLVFPPRSKRRIRIREILEDRSESLARAREGRREKGAFEDCPFEKSESARKSHAAPHGRIRARRRANGRREQGLA